MKCSICGNLIEGRGNSAKPINEGRCCDKCNFKVISARSRMIGVDEDTFENLEKRGVL